MEDLIVNLFDNDDATVLRGKFTSPSVKDVEMLTASIIATLSEKAVQNIHIVRSAKILGNDVSERR